jgi:hypothetical protein
MDLKTDPRYRQIENEEIESLLDKKFKLVYSHRLAKKVYVLKEWVDKPVFDRHRKLFGYTDIGWTVKYPKQLVRILLKEGTWKE